jgi:F-type H+-transporting ATPase subunit a
MRLNGKQTTENRTYRTRALRVFPAVAVLAAGCWIAGGPLAALAQEHGAGHNAPAAANAPHAPAANTPEGSSVSSPSERGEHQGTHEPGPGGLGAPQTGTHEAGEHAAPGHAAGGAHGAGEHEEEHEEISIHFPTLIYGPLKNWWYAGPATISADGAMTPEGTPIDGATLKGQKAEMEYLDHHSHAKPKPTYKIQPTLGTIGKRTPGPGVKTETITVNGSQVVLLNPVVDFKRQHWMPEHLLISVWTAFLVGLVGFLMTRTLTLIPSKRQMFVEVVYNFFDEFVSGLIGEHYKRYLPLIATAFLYILVMNLAGLIPAWASPTANLNVTAGMAIVVVIYVQYEGIRVNGFGGYLKHFMGEPAWLAPLNFPLHIIGELARVLSLSMRLFGNIFGEDVVIVILIILAGMFTGGFVPIQAPMYLMALFTSLVQAMVFSILASVYIALMTAHHDDDHAHGEHGHHGHEHAGEAMPAPAV